MPCCFNKPWWHIAERKSIEDDGKLVPKIQLQWCSECIAWLVVMYMGLVVLVSADVSCGQKEERGTDDRKSWMMSRISLSHVCVQKPHYKVHRSKYNINDEEVIGRSIFTTSFYFPPTSSWEVWPFHYRGDPSALMQHVKFANCFIHGRWFRPKNTSHLQLHKKPLVHSC